MSRVEYTWDYHNRLTKVTYLYHTDTSTPWANAVKDKVVDYTYDVFNRLVKKTLDSGGNGSIEQEEGYVYDGQNIALKFAGGDGVPRAQPRRWPANALLGMVQPAASRTRPSKLSAPFALAAFTTYRLGADRQSAAIRSRTYGITAIRQSRLSLRQRGLGFADGEATESRIDTPLTWKAKARRLNVGGFGISHARCFIQIWWLSPFLPKSLWGKEIEFVESGQWSVVGWEGGRGKE